MQISKTQSSNYSSFLNKHKLMAEKYGNAIDFSASGCKFLTMDLIEIDDDIKTIGPTVQGIIDGTIDPKNLEQSLFALEANLWHLIDHLKSLDRSIKYLWKRGSRKHSLRKVDTNDVKSILPARGDRKSGKSSANRSGTKKK